MKKYFLTLIATLTITFMASAPCSADDIFASSRDRWLEIAERCKPQLIETIVRPVSVVEAVHDSAAFQYWRFEPCGSPDSLLYNRNIKEVKKITLDFGKHLTGYLTFSTRTLSRSQDAPVRLKFFFGELPAELNTPLYPWKGGLSRAWMQDEVVTIQNVDTRITIPRRVASRYLTIELLGASPDFDFAIDDLEFRALTSAEGAGQPLSATTSDRMRRIHNVGVETLRECMQTVFEDGPKRDRRLWAGDLYLQSIANRHSFRNFDLTKRCLYLFAALSDSDGYVLSNIFESPRPHPQYGSYCVSYSLLWNSTLLEYLKDTADAATAHDLWPVASRQIDLLKSYIGPDGLVDMSLGKPYVWNFFDWREGLDQTALMQGASIFALDQSAQLASTLGHTREAREWSALADKMRKAARCNMFDKKKGVIVSGPACQVSALAQAWMTKAGVLKGAQAAKALRTALSDSETLMPGTPYATHYLVEAMIDAGMHSEAKDYLEAYWGGMVDKGADTFWESYDPDNDFISAYNFSPLNSACHAWSCTPVYFIHAYPQIFQR